jgi:hypothetical protein
MLQKFKELLMLREDKHNTVLGILWDEMKGF